ncbi:alanine--tRNA ligase [Alphaproteobacteria bacterium]|jgi:alanyl-tRNA synthetase|nr:alanine--tRNA ligase [Alphaproteobacteria bacterium]
MSNNNSVNEIRSKFIDYFKKNDHLEISSSNLIPENDPTLLFTNAGMVQFKNTFTGLESRDYKRAVTSQKCLRAGGKHNDLENVGKTARHHTFFEMLGNFSFGDYFKEKAIYQAWELLTKEYGLPKEKLLVTIFHDDIEAENLWRKIAGLNHEKIIKIKTSDNFWSMGDTGPCGPCSEIFYDHGPSVTGGPPGSKDEDGDRFIEIWNLVFMQYEQVSVQERVNLPKPSIDTGMGLERISAVLQNTHNNYETDMMKNLVEASSLVTGVDTNFDNIISHRVVADHLRSISFLIAEGLLPSNEGRGYVLRRIMRRAMRHTHILGATDPIIYKLVNYLIKEMGNAFPELKTHKDVIERTINDEEIKFKDTLDRGMSLLMKVVDKKVSGGVLPGEKAFELYDTYGFPIDLTEDVLSTYGWTVDHDGFNRSMNDQKNKARKSWSGSGDTQYNQKILKTLLDLPETNFHGYTKSNLDSKVDLIIQNNKIVKEVSKGEQAEIISNETIFYAESGGQISDNGNIIGDKCKAKVLHSKKLKLSSGKVIYLTFVEITDGSLLSGQKITQKIDIELRKQICAHHSATHLLHEALRQKLGLHVAQKGSLVTSDKLRFDFSHNKSLTLNEIKAIEDQVNHRIFCNDNVVTEIMTPTDAAKTGAIALFGEKYGEEVRVVSIGKSVDGNRNAWSVEFCGGTHVKNTSEISSFKIISETGISSGVRRIEAVTNKAAIKYYQNEINKIKYIADFMKSNTSQVTQKIEHLVQENEKIYKELRLLKKNSGVSKDQSFNKETLKDITFVYQIYDDLIVKDLKPTAESILKSGDIDIVCLISKINNKASIVISVKNSLTNNISAIDLVNIVSKTLGGKGGGGRPDMAQSGGSNPEKSLDAIKLLKEHILNL